MQDHIERMGMSKNPRRLLVGSLQARKVLLATPLLKWYLEHGLQVCDAHQVMEYVLKACFRQFTDRVSNARRDGDRDSSPSSLPTP